jgi:Kelch motif protein
MRKRTGIAGLCATAATLMLLAGSATAATTTIPFTPTAPMSIPRDSPAAAPLADGRVLVVGGQTTGGTFLKSAEIYNPQTGTFSATGSMSFLRYGPAAAPLSDGRVLVAGGYNGSIALKSAEIFDPKTGAFTTVAPMAVARFYAAAAPLADGRVLVAGGYAGGVPIGDAEVYNPATNSWSTVTPLPDIREAPGAAKLPDGRILVAGGFTGAASANRTAEVFDPKTNTFSSAGLGLLSVTREFTAASPLTDGRAVLVAGYDGTANDLASAEIFDPITGTFSSSGLGSLSFPREDIAASPLLGGRVLVVGGYTLADGKAHSEAEILGTSNSFTTSLKGATLIVRVSSAGQVTVTGSSGGSKKSSAVAAKKKKLLKTSKRSGGPGKIKVKLKLLKTAKAKLASKGHLKVPVTITFSPSAGFAGSQSSKLKLRSGKK